MGRYVQQKPLVSQSLLELLLLLLLAVEILAICPSVCSCSHGHREVDCSWRGLRQLPHSLQHNLRSLNLSHNRLHDLDGRLTRFAHLRVLDLSHNRLSRLPAELPRSLWQLYASANRIRLLDKNDTAYQWNLRLLDLSNNRLERAVFINNTLVALRLLNLSHNHFWTVPTNLPMPLETIDLSHNSLVQVFPGSLDRLPLLGHFYLHVNRFSTLPFGLFDRLTGLRVITLGDNPWACQLHANITYLQLWMRQTTARVLGCPCHNEHVCGRAARTGGWHFGSYDLPPLAANAQDPGFVAPESTTAGGWYRPGPALLNTLPGSRGHWDPVDGRPSTPSPSTLPPGTSSTDNGPDPKRLSSTTKPLSPSQQWPPAGPSVLLTQSALVTGGRAPATNAVVDHTNPTSVTAAAAHVTLEGGHASTAVVVSVSKKKTTTVRTRSVRRPNQSISGGTNSIFDSCFFSTIPCGLFFLVLNLPQVL